MNCEDSPVRRNGDRVSTLDLLGAGFTVLADGTAWYASAAYASAKLGVPITVHDVGEVLGLGLDGALLVRPDDFVGWRADNLPDDPDRELCRAVSAILGRRWAVKEECQPPDV
jgi:hypothetical protein